MKFIMPVHWEEFNPIGSASQPCPTEVLAGYFFTKLSESIHHLPFYPFKLALTCHKKSRGYLSNRAELDVTRSTNSMDYKANVVHLVG